MGIIVRIDSRDKSATNQTNTNFNVNLHPIHTKTARVKQIIIPNLFDNIRSSPTSDNNSTFSYETGGVPGSITIPDGFYNMANLITYMETELVALLITFVLNDDTGKITISNGGGATFNVLNLDDGNLFADVLGIRTSEIVNGGADKILLNKANLYSYQMVYVVSNKLSNSYNLLSSGGRLPIICTVPILPPYGGIINYEPSTEHDIFYGSDNNLENIDISLVNHNGEVITLPSNHHIQVLMELNMTNVK